MVINQSFNSSGRQYIRIGKSDANWSRSDGNKQRICWNAKKLIKHINYLIDRIHVTCGDSVFRQIIGIPMGTDCAPFLANLFLYSHECEWMCKMLKENVLMF